MTDKEPVIVGFVPARGGSERIPGKNLQLVGGRSLVRRAVECAWEAGCHEVVVSTDDDAIAVEAHYCDAEVHERQARHASATAQIEDAIGDWLGTRLVPLAESDVVVLLQPTSPFRRPSTVEDCVRLVLEGYDSALSISMGHRRNGRIRSHVAADGGQGPLKVIWNQPNPLWRPRSQDVVQEPYENGAVYAFSVGHWRRARCRMGGREAVVRMEQWEAWEIDTPGELAIARAMVEAGVAA